MGTAAGQRRIRACTLPEQLWPLARLNPVDVRTSRLNADVWDLSGSVMKALGETWPPAAPGAAIYAAVSSRYAFLAGGGRLLVLIASMFEESVHAGTIFGTGLFLVNALVVLRVSIHPRIRDLTRRQARRSAPCCTSLRSGYVIPREPVDAVMVIVFGAIPAVLFPCGVRHATPRQELGTGGGG